MIQTTIYFLVAYRWILFRKGIAKGIINNLLKSGALRVACLPIVDVPVHIVMGMPMTVGMGMRVAISMGTKKYIIGIAHGYSHGHAHYILAVPMTFSMGTKEIHNFVNWYYTLGES